MRLHGSNSGAADEIVTVIKAVRHPNFKIWYDAGNIIDYTGKDPIEELKPVAQHVTGFCAKDCGAVKGDVMIQFGTGRVDYASAIGSSDAFLKRAATLRNASTTAGSKWVPLPRTINSTVASCDRLLA